MASSMTLILRAIEQHETPRPGPEYHTVEEIQEAADPHQEDPFLTLETVRYRLEKAVSRGTIVKLKAGRRVYYAPAYDILEDALEDDPALQAEPAGNPYMEL